MSDTAASQDAGALPAVQPSAPIETPESFSDASEAARHLGRLSAEKRRLAKEQTQDAPAAPEQDDAPQEDLPEATPAETAEAPADEAETVEAVEVPPIDPPRSWPKEDKDFFDTLPRQAQERIVQREAERDRLTLRGSNELSEQRKVIEAETQKLGQLRQQYESRLPLVGQVLQASLAADFPDIKSQEDVQRLAAQDPARYIQWDAKQKQLAEWQSEAQAAHQRQQQESSERLNKWIETQDSEIEKLFEKTPKPQRDALANEAKKMLLDYGFTEEQVGNLWQSSILRSAPLQRIMADAARFRIAQRTATKPAVKPVPPVQRPGTVMPARNSADAAEITRLEGKDSLTLNEATRLLELKAKRRAA